MFFQSEDALYQNIFFIYSFTHQFINNFYLYNYLLTKCLYMYVIIISYEIWGHACPGIHASPTSWCPCGIQQRFPLPQKEGRNAHPGENTPLPF